MTKEKPVHLNQTGKDLEKIRDLILHNDEVNTFEFVIDTLIEVCGHNPEQAEQCAMLAHFRGKCGVKHAAVRILQPLFLEMTNRGLTVTID